MRWGGGHYAGVMSLSWVMPLEPFHPAIRASRPSLHSPTQSQHSSCCSKALLGLLPRKKSRDGGARSYHTVQRASCSAKSNRHAQHSLASKVRWFTRQRPCAAPSEDVVANTALTVNGSLPHNVSVKHCPVCREGAAVDYCHPHICSVVGEGASQPLSCETTTKYQDLRCNQQHHHKVYVAAMHHASG